MRGEKPTKIGIKTVKELEAEEFQMTIDDIIQSKKKTKDINIMGVVHIMDPVYKLSVKRTAMKQGDT